MGLSNFSFFYRDLPPQIEDISDIDDDIDASPAKPEVASDKKKVVTSAPRDTMFDDSFDDTDDDMEVMPSITGSPRKSVNRGVTHVTADVIHSCKVSLLFVT